MGILAVGIGLLVLSAGFPTAALSLPQQLYLAGNVALEGREGLDDEPSMARAGNGNLYVAWINYKDGAERLQVAQYSAGSPMPEPSGTWQIGGGPDVRYSAPKVVPADDGAFVLYSQERDGDWEVFAVRCGDSGPGKPFAISPHPAVDVKPAGAWHDGALWVAWETNRGGPRQVWATAVREGRNGPAEAVSGKQGSGYAPAVAVRSNGRVSIAWHAFRNHNYDIFLRERTSRGWDEERQITHALTVDRHPVLATRGDELWLAYENSRIRGYRIGQTYNRKIVVAEVTTDGLATPEGFKSRSGLYLGGEFRESREETRSAESPAFAFDGAGRLWIAYLRPLLRGKGWQLCLTGYDGSGWFRELRPASHLGRDRAPSIVIDGARAAIAYQVDDLPGGFRTASAVNQVKSDVFLATVELPPAVASAGDFKLDPFVESDDSFEAGRLRVAFGEDAATPSIGYGGQDLKLYYGDLHAHSDVSVCMRDVDQSIDEEYQTRRDITGLDFVAITDHGYNLTPYLWSYTAKLARMNEDPGRLLTFLAEEWTSTFEEYSEKYPYGFYGHRNVIFEDAFFPKWWNARNRQTPAELWEDIRRTKASSVTIPHQLADTGNVPTAWDYSDEEQQPVAEIFQQRGSYEFKGARREAGRTTPGPGTFLQDAWARGLVIGVIASPDHGGGLGKACVYAPDLSRKAVLEAIRKRHTFGTTGSRVFLDVRVNGRLMGEKIPAANGKPVEVAINVRCPTEIERVQVCRNNQFVYVNEPDARETQLIYVDKAPPDGPLFYYVRVVQRDQEIAWSSPVWLGTKSK